ncbi:MAG: protease modulator HflC [Mariprofundaceae bacterium]|nr:protease modulator HflC [Mariprofundaceae bacterium]
MNLNSNLIAIVLMVVLWGISLSTYIVDQREQVIVFSFGETITVKNKLDPDHLFKIADTMTSEAGLYFKWFWQDVKHFDKRLLIQDANPNEVITKDKKTIEVDNYTRWLITDPLIVYQTAQTQQGVAMRMEDVVRGKVREVLGQHTLQEIVSGGADLTLRRELTEKILKLADHDVQKFGIKIVDIRIKRADLPSENSNAVFLRMKAERQRIAKEYRSEGEEAAKEIRAQADKEVKVLHAQAYKKSEIIRGKAEAKANAIYVKEHEKSPDFYGFMRSLEAYRASLGEGTRLVISPDSEFFDYFKGSNR